MELRARIACKTAGSAILDCSRRIFQKRELKVPGSFVTVRSLNHSRCSFCLLVFAGNTDSDGCGGCRISYCLLTGNWLPPPQIPYPSHVRPVETHRRQAGRPSSHFTRRILNRTINFQQIDSVWRLTCKSGTLILLWFYRLQRPWFDAMRNRKPREVCHVVHMNCHLFDGSETQEFDRIRTTSLGNFWRRIQVYDRPVESTGNPCFKLKLRGSAGDRAIGLLGNSVR